MASSSEKAARKAERKLLQQQRIQQAQQAAEQLNSQDQMETTSENGGGGAKVAHEEEILEAIDQLRRRKARPDADRICNYLLRKCSVDARDTIAALRKLIESEKVIQVDYKGNTSYRNASKWSRLQLYKNRPEGFVKEKFTSNMVALALGELVIVEPDYLEQGVPALRLVEQLLDGVSTSNPTSRRMVEDFLTKEVASGNLARLSNGNYSVADGGGNTSSLSPQQNGDTTPRSKGSSLAGSTSATPVKKDTANTYDLNELDDLTIEEHESSANLIKSSRQTSPKNDGSGVKKDDCFEIIVGRRLLNDSDENKNKHMNGELSNGYHKEDNVKQNGRALNSEKEDSKNSSDMQSNHKKSKTERKQRFCVRSDDSPDLLFKYEDYRKENYNKDEEDKRYDENDRLSEDGENDHDAGRSSTNPSPTPSHTNTGGFRSARRKRAKKVFDPSDNMVVKRKRGRYSNAAKAAMAMAQQDSQDSIKVNSVKENVKDSHRHCNECSKDKDEALIACRDCTVRVHPSCIYTQEEIALKADTSWQCEDCKTCAHCFETKSLGPLVTCFNCDDSYHYSCHSPKVSSSKAKWFCHKCNPKPPKPVLQNSNLNCNQYNSINIRINNNSEQKSNNIIIKPIVPSPQVSPTRNAPEEIDEEKFEIDPNIPDVANWSSEQVYQYLTRLCPREAEVFRTQDIDGQALLLLERSTILKDFGLRMGPALKVWRQVVILQHRRDDTSLYWL